MADTHVATLYRVLDGYKAAGRRGQAVATAVVNLLLTSTYVMLDAVSASVPLRVHVR